VVVVTGADRSLVHVVDVSVQAEVEAMVAAAVARSGRLDVHRRTCWGRRESG
jgi:hypothetical protein